MNTSVDRHYYQGGYDFQFLNPLDSRYECPICLLCQRDPVQTVCGHRFCKSCIATWLTEGKTCPDDNTQLNENDIFPDAIASREISQLDIKCTNYDKGCQETLTIAKLEEHLRNCQFQPNIDHSSESLTCQKCGELLDSNIARNHRELICPNASVVCTFMSVGCSAMIKRKDVMDHMNNNTSQHMKLLAEKLAKVQQLQQAQQICSNNCQGEEDDVFGQTSSPLQRNFNGTRLSNNSQASLIRDLYQKIVTLEQSNYQQEIKISSLTSHLEKLQVENESLALRNLNGEFLWKIKEFSSYHQKLRNNHNFVIYSKGFYTSHYGYKVCLRSNLYIQEGEEYLGMFVHFMKSENDDILRWPWNGTISMELINQEQIKENFVESMDSVYDSEAFRRPEDERNCVGFGFQTFIRINSLYTQGFVSSQLDTLFVKATVKSIKNL